MKRIIVLGLVLALLSSCVTQRRCNTKYPTSVDTTYIETIRDSIIYKDTIIYVEIKGETIIDSIFIPCPEVPGYVPQKVFAETELARASAWWSYPSIKLELIQKDTTISIRLDNALKEAYYWKDKYLKVIVKPQTIEVIPERFKTYRNIVFFIFSLGFLFIGWKLYKFFKK